MNYNQFGQCQVDTEDLVQLLYQTPELDIGKFYVHGDSLTQYNEAVKSQYADFPLLNPAKVVTGTIEEFDQVNQDNWHMPAEYKKLDIAEFILGLCQTQAELQRVGEELLLFQERDLFNLLRYLKYFVDTMRKNNIVWGLGRGSSVASYVLYLLGVHKINSLYYDLPIEEFLK